MRTRADIEGLEEKLLHPFAEQARSSVGRLHREPPHSFRTAYQRDRARIVHSKAFRRLEYKTQVFLNGTGDHFRTRLTHTMEVSSISRSIALSLGLNQDLAEAIALAHDLGHSPFGHSGEKTLNRLMKDHGGFEHNKQSLRVVQKLEHKYPMFDGLNLSYEVLEGIDKHGLSFRKPGSSEEFFQPSLEAQIANLADEIAYYSHDIDDGIDAGLISVDQLMDLDIWRQAFESAKSRVKRLTGSRLVAFTIRTLIDIEVDDVIQSSSANIEQAGIRSPDDARRQKRPLIRLSPSMAKSNKAMRSFLFKNLYYSQAVSEMNKRACSMLEAVFHAYTSEPRLLPSELRRRTKKEGLPRVLCDYLSGMTDRFLIDEHHHLVEINSNSAS